MTTIQADELSSELHHERSCDTEAPLDTVYLQKTNNSMEPNRSFITYSAGYATFVKMVIQNSPKSSRYWVTAFPRDLGYIINSLAARLKILLQAHTTHILVCSYHLTS